MSSAPNLALRTGWSLALALATGGCVSSAVHQTSDVYYREGPEQAIEAVDGGPVREADLTLVALEKAVALLEIGKYAESAALLRACDTEFELQKGNPAAAVTKAVVNDEAAPYRPEGFERVFIHTLAMADWLALQDLPTAATEAELALATIDALRCDACTFPFTRYLAAVTFDALGDPVRALDVLAEAVAESPGIPFLEEELQRMAEAEPCPAFDHPDDLLAPAPDSRRVLHVLLMLGRGPVKVPNAVPVPWSHAVAWPTYEARWPEGVSGAILVADGGRGHRAELLTEMLPLARSSLRARLAGLIARESVKTVAQEALLFELGEEHWTLELLGRMLFASADPPDLRHWSTLPATCQVIRVAVDAVDRCELVYLGPDGEPVDSEVLELPPEWLSGPLFVTRRMP